MNQDEEHLRLLSIFHYVVGALAAMFALFPIFHLVIGLVMVLPPCGCGGRMYFHAFRDGTWRFHNHCANTGIGEGVVYSRR